MKKNMGTMDRAIRIAIAFVFGILLLTETVHGVLAAVIGVLAVVFLVTSALGFCPMYMPCKFSSCKPTEAAKK